MRVCDPRVDPETDRHLVRRSVFKDPEIALAEREGEVLCLECARPHLEERTRELAEQLAVPGQ